MDLNTVGHLLLDDADAAMLTFAGLDVAELMARAPTTLARSGTDQRGVRTTTTFKVTGRHVFNVWRIMRSEQTLGSYTLRTWLSICCVKSERLNILKHITYE
ncbi:hypothetical protein JVT61DRAFT_3937 [Boletus reticuloceps]|uniref:Uncharacterized protein n=1 Tax=Boletus reticuloceps TaxID=495285 RepID=A0A8I2YN02_9AGAM|nr:hypothetical protein JVT61DRAFT_3937 [Boletus reticuloceps]